MSQVFHDIEKKILETLQKVPNQTPGQLSTNTELSIDQVRRGIEWLRLKDLAIVDESQKVTFSDSFTIAKSFRRNHSIPLRI